MSKDAESPGDDVAHGGEPHQPIRAAYGGAARIEGCSQSRLNPDWGQERGYANAADGTEPHPLILLVIVIVPNRVVRSRSRSIEVATVNSRDWKCSFPNLGEKCLFQIWEENVLSQIRKMLFKNVEKMCVYNFGFFPKL